MYLILKATGSSAVLWKSALYFCSYGLCCGDALFSILVCPQYYLLLPGVVQCVLSWLVLHVKEWHVVMKNATEDVSL